MTANAIGLAAAISLVFLLGTTRVQAADGDPDTAGPSPGAALRQVSAVCAGEIARFCPELSDPVSPRNQVICLKPFKSDLSLACRGTVNAAGR